MITRTARSESGWMSGSEYGRRMSKVDCWHKHVEAYNPGIGFEIPQGPILGMGPRASGDSVKQNNVSWQICSFKSSQCHSLSWQCQAGPSVPATDTGALNIPKPSPPERSSKLQEQLGSFQGSHLLIYRSSPSRGNGSERIKTTRVFTSK